MAVRSFLNGLRALFRRRQEEAELSEELRAYVESAAEEKMASGMSREQALRSARAEVGSAAAVKDDVRDVGWESRLYSIGQDLRYALRMLRKYPGFAAVAILSLTLAIGANTALFSLFNTVFLKKLPVHDPNRLVVLEWESGPKEMARWINGNTRHEGDRTLCTSFPYLTLERMRQANQTLESVFAFSDSDQVNVNVDGTAEIAYGQVVTGNYFSGIGATATVGRTLLPDDDRSTAAPAAVISYAYWQRRFGGDARVIGKRVGVNNVEFTIVGVTAPGFAGALDNVPVDVTVPLAMEPLVLREASTLRASLPVVWWLRIMGRRKSDVNLEQVQANLAPVFQQSAFETWQMGPMSAGEEKVTLSDAPALRVLDGSRGLTDARAEFLRPIAILMCIVALVLLIACVNVANMLLARAEARQREIAIRLAIGAGRARVLRQLLTESLLLSLLSGVSGAGLAFALRGSLPALVPWAESIQVQLDWRVLGFTVACSVLTGLLFGLAPALRARRLGVGSSLKEGARSSTGRHAAVMSKALVVAQVALSVVLLIAAGLFLRSLRNLEHVDLGFDAENLLLFRVNPRLSGYDPQQIAPLYDRLAERLQAVPGVKAVAISRHPLLAFSSRIQRVAVLGGGQKNLYMNAVGPAFLETMGIDLVAGRGITARDDANSSRVVVLNQTAAKMLFGAASPLGRELRLGTSNTTRFEIVGVARDAKYTNVRQNNPATAYTSLRQEPLGQANFEVKTVGTPASLADSVRAAVHEVDGNLPIFDVKTQTERAGETISQEKLFAGLSSSFGALALVLAAIGLFGVMSYAVARRTSEIAIRLALGAKQKGVLLMVVRETLTMVVAGTAIGVPCAFAAARVLQKALVDVLYRVQPTDPLTFAMAAAGLLAIGALAAYVPARRAAAVDPMVALRYE